MAPEAEKPVVERFADAQIDDWVWLIYDMSSRKPEIVQVTGRTRQSIIVRDTKFDLATGRARSSGNFTDYRHIEGRAERLESWWRAQSHALAKEIQQCKDVEQLKSIAFIVGYEPQPPTT